MQENRSSGFPTRSDINRPGQLQKMAGSLKFWILEENELYYIYIYPCSESKGPDYCTVDLHLFFRTGRNQVFSLRGSHCNTVAD